MLFEGEQKPSTESLLNSEGHRMNSPLAAGEGACAPRVNNRGNLGVGGPLIFLPRRDRLLSTATVRNSFLD